ncbi:putative glycosyltransferase [Cardamine amara subsp. amara]|uniref:Glycosyltransferase n=1 Tax=Cardamine amara subsp. amara TaxID=228776 RepID=A0ABD0Z367_CARAN
MRITCFLVVHSSPNLNSKNTPSSFVDAKSSPSPSLSMEFNAASSNFTLNLSPQKKEKKKKNIIEKGLAKSRAAIREAVRWKKHASDKEETFIPRGAVYRNAFASVSFSPFLLILSLIFCFTL